MLDGMMKRMGIDPAEMQASVGMIAESLHRTSENTAAIAARLAAIDARLAALESAVASLGGAPAGTFAPDGTFLQYQIGDENVGDPFGR
jgi:hypothetical protein